MSSTAPATTSRLTRRTKAATVTPERATGFTHLFRNADETSPWSPDCVAEIVWSVDRVKGEATADVAVDSQPASRLFTGELLSSVLLEAIKWAEAEVSR